MPPDQVHRVGLAVEQGVETRAEDDTQRTGRCRARLHGTPRGGHALGAFARVRLRMHDDVSRIWSHGFLKTTLEAKFNKNLNASAPVIGPGTNNYYTKCWILI